MLPDRVSNPGPLTYESGALPIALRGPAFILKKNVKCLIFHFARNLLILKMVMIIKNQSSVWHGIN